MIKFQVTFKIGEADFPQDHGDKYRDHCNGILEWGWEIGLNSEDSVGKWEFTAKK